MTKLLKQTLNIRKFQNFANLLIPVKIHKIWGEIQGFPAKRTKHFLQDFQCRHGAGGGWIFSGIAHLYCLKSIPWRLAEFYYNRGLQRPYTGTCIIMQETINKFLYPVIMFLKGKTHQLDFEERD